MTLDVGVKCSLSHRGWLKAVRGRVAAGMRTLCRPHQNADHTSHGCRHVYGYQLPWLIIGIQMNLQSIT